MKSTFKLAAGILTAFTTLTVVGLIKKPGSVYRDEPEDRNSMQGKRVRFVSNPADPVNADGMRGHLEAVGSSEHKVGVYEKYVKRGLDIVLSGFGLILLNPVYAVISLAIVLDDPGPVLFVQKRVGKDKRYFKLHKFRSMKMDTPANVPTHMLEDPEKWITSVGRFLRAHSLDELPQIWDIWLGNMSVIGPRPALWNQDLLTACRA